MKVALVMVVSMSAVAYAQDVFDGDWRGKLGLLDYSSEVPIRVWISGGEAYNYKCEDSQWLRFGSESRSFVVQRNNALLSWINEGGVWTETQIFSLSYVNEDTLALVWARHVNNIKSEGDYDTWQMFGRGTLKKSDDSSINCD